MRVLAFIYIDFRPVRRLEPSIKESLVGGKILRVGGKHAENLHEVYQVYSEKYEINPISIDDDILSFVKANASISSISLKHEITVQRALLSLASTDCDAGEHLSIVIDKNTMMNVAQAGYSLEIWNAEVMPSARKWDTYMPAD